MPTDPAAPDTPKVLIIGLDCATPEWLFHHPDYDLPNIHRVMAQGSYAPLRSCDPPITVPAWSCMMSGRDPGALGIYGFRNRRNRFDYSDYTIATAHAVNVPRLWDILSEADKQVCVIGVPQTFPVSPVNGCMVSGILTPGQDTECTYPPDLKSELITELGSLQFDVEGFRQLSADILLEKINDFLHHRFDLAEYLMRTKAWDFFMMVDMGVDRLHHAFWHYGDPAHPKFTQDSPHRWAMRDYYQALDQRIGRLLASAGEDTKILIVSDHGAKAMHGGVRINQWLMNEGYLTLKTAPTQAQAFRLEDVDWSRTSAWGEGGYYGRIFLNVAGREAQGCVPPDAVDRVKAELKVALESMRDPHDTLMGNRVMFPEDLYPEVNGVAPDLMVYFGDLHWRSLGEVGCSSLLADSNDTGADAANHALDGIVIAREPQTTKQLSLVNATLMDVAPTVLSWMGIDIPPAMQGRDWTH